MGVLGLNSDRINCPVNTDPTGQFDDRTDRVLALEVDDLGALAPGDRQAILAAVDGNDPTCAHQLGGRNRELSHRPAAEHRDCVTFLDLGHVGAEPGGREDVRDHDRLIVGDFIGQFHQSNMGERDSRLLGLQPVEAARSLRAAKESGARAFPAGVGIVALRIIAGAAIGAATAGDRRGDHHPVAHLEVAHHVAYSFDDADTLMAEDPAFLHAAEGAADEVQVGAADCRGGQPDDRVGRLFDLRIRDILNADIADPAPNHCLHVEPPKQSRPGQPIWCLTKALSYCSKKNFPGCRHR
jgi:hypothetical protein